MDLEIVDVFAETPLAGNPLAVVRNADTLSVQRMQAIALEMNFSETTFVISEAADRARVRIFTPIQELPFAGHPTLGTAWVLGRNQSRFTLELDGGDVGVDFRDGVAWMRSPPVTFGEPESPEDIAKILGMDPDHLDSRFAPRRGNVGIEFLVVGLKSLEALRRIDLSLEQLRALPALGLFLFTADGYPGGADYAARMFFEASGLREDPATGSANCVLAEYLMATRGPDFSASVDQGVEMGRPSRIYLEVSGGQPQVGGKVQPVASGRLTLES